MRDVVVIGCVWCVVRIRGGGGCISSDRLSSGSGSIGTTRVSTRVSPSTNLSTSTRVSLSEVARAPVDP